MFSLDNEKKGSRQAMSEDIITRILDRNNLNEAFKRVKANKGASIFVIISSLIACLLPFFSLSSENII